MRIVIRLAAPALLIVAMAVAAICRPDRAVQVATGMAAHDLCSETFVAGLDPAQTFAESIAPRPGFALIAWGVRYRIDRVRHDATADFLGLSRSRAVFRGKVGCTLVFDDRPLPAIDVPSPGAALWPDFAPALVTPADPVLAAAIDAAFTEPDLPPHRFTKAVVILRDGQIVAERYAPGYGPDTPILGFSMSKSITQALIGMLVRDGKLAIDAPAPVAAWQGRDDPRRAITLDQMMRMQSGLDLDEDDGGFDPSNRMFYTEPDMAAFAQTARLRAPPGTRWAYSSATTHLLAQIVRDRAGGTAEAVQALAFEDLFGPLGMRHVTMEVDTAGTPVGAHYMFASARDWARFGYLYAQDGQIGGTRLLPAGWADVAARVTPGTDYAYGAGWWTNRGGLAHPFGHVGPGVPDDAFFAFGNLGQRLAVIPSAHLVVVRLGRSHQAPGDINRDFAKLIVAALPPSSVLNKTGRP